MNTTNRDARIVGFLYLLFVMLGIFALRYVPSLLIVHGDAAATARNIAGHELLFRFEIGADLLAGLWCLLISLALYELFKDVDHTQAVLLVILGGLLVTPLYFFNAVNHVAALLLVTGTDLATAFSAPQRDALALFFLSLYHYELLASFIFAGLWLFPFGVLVYKSGFIPKVLGVWLVVNGFAYLAIAIAGFMLPAYVDIVDKITEPILFGEIAVMLWLLIFGARFSAHRLGAQ